MIALSIATNDKKIVENGIRRTKQAEMERAQRYGKRASDILALYTAYLVAVIWRESIVRRNC